MRALGYLLSSLVVFVAGAAFGAGMMLYWLSL